VVLTMLWKLDAAAEPAVNTSLGIDCIEGALLVGSEFVSCTARSSLAFDG